MAQIYVISCVFYLILFCVLRAIYILLITSVHFCILGSNKEAGKIECTECATVGNEVISNNNQFALE